MNYSVLLPKITDEVVTEILNINLNNIKKLKIISSEIVVNKIQFVHNRNTYIIEYYGQPSKVFVIIISGYNRKSDPYMVQEEYDSFKLIYKKYFDIRNIKQIDQIDSNQLKLYRIPRDNVFSLIEKFPFIYDRFNSFGELFCSVYLQGNEIKDIEEFYQIKISLI